MRWPPRLLPCLIICLTSLPVIPQPAKAKEEGEPQMVWLYYAEGEVKFSPGRNGKPELGNDWIEANAGQVMEGGYTLATEKGRAEIEFEDGTVVYLAESSVLEFNRLWAKAGATDTRLNLLTGTATIAHASSDAIHVRTPAVRMRFVSSQTARLESTLDGVVFHAVEGDLPIVRGPSGMTTLKEGESAAYAGGIVIPLKEPKQIREGEEWDRWVAVRLAERRALLAEGLNESGLKEPIPGLAGMVKNGTFSDCAPYGKCWEPNEMRHQEETQTAPAAAGSAQASGRTRKPKIVVDNTMLLRCPVEAWRLSAIDLLPPQGQLSGLPGQPLGAGNVIEYGTCFAGNWAHGRWVAGPRHHHYSCHFVKVGRHEIGIVPRHPLDQKGHPLVNAKSGVLVLAVEKGKLQAGVQSAPSKGIQLLAKPPSGLERGLLVNAPRVAQPVIQARLTENLLPHGTLSAVRTGEQKNVTAIRFDFKTGNFVGRSGTGGDSHGAVVAHVGSGGGVSGGGSHGSSGGGSSGGGGGHSGGGSSGGSSAGGNGGGHH
jgi:hypothetical protein